MVRPMVTSPSPSPPSLDENSEAGPGDGPALGIRPTRMPGPSSGWGGSGTPHCSTARRMGGSISLRGRRGAARTTVDPARGAVTIRNRLHSRPWARGPSSPTWWASGPRSPDTASSATPVRPHNAAAVNALARGVGSQRRQAERLRPWHFASRCTQRDAGGLGHRHTPWPGARSGVGGA